MNNYYVIQSNYLEFCPQHCEESEMWCPGPYDSGTEKASGPNTCMPFYDESGCDNHCPVYCSDDEELVNGDEFLNWYLGYVYCKQPDYCVPVPEGKNCIYKQLLFSTLKF